MSLDVCITETLLMMNEQYNIIGRSKNDNNLSINYDDAKSWHDSIIVYKNEVRLIDTW